MSLIAVIPSHPSRTEWLGGLSDSLLRIGISPHIVDVTGNPREDVYKVLGELESSAHEWVLHVEDDAIIGTRIASWEALLPESLDAVSLFSLRDRPPGYQRVPWSGTVCFAVRPAKLAGITEWAPTWYDEHPHHSHAFDLLLRDWFKIHALRHATIFPSLVQHREGPSLLGPRSSKRVSPTYEG